ncbi:hypothetical protein [Streptomyces doebereineriae]|uniref:Lipoprotein n=1 Tax=Streptomyces doebereineriae TaxID=3075528 RepID=A0ABU2VKI9_9ACTN|nr:hypothetical protein [Streptomyces sp. DSM 41640]MDT0486108.1 hypothetical protein [Streptomyces sp. DSM 41640]
MKRSSRARIGSAATVSVLSLALITGCSGGSDDDSKESGASKEAGASSSSTAPAAKARSAAELEKLLLAKGAVTGYEAADGDDTLPKAKSEVKTDKAECAPLAHAMAGLAPGDTDASVSNTLTKSPDATPSAGEEAVLNVEMTFVGLSSYDGDGAEKAVKAVSDGIAACSGGFTITAEGEKQKITKVASGKASGKGDESVAFSVGADMDGEGTATFNTEVVRVGNTVSTYYTVDFASLESGKAAPVSTAVIDAQLAKLK